MVHEVTTKGMTDLQSRVIDLRHLGRLTFRQIGKAMGISAPTAYEHYAAGMRHMSSLDLPENAEAAKYSRLEKREYIDDRLALYDQIAKDNVAKHPRTAIEALNGAFKYLELLVRLEGIEAPTRHQLEITMEQVEAKINSLEASLSAEGSYEISTE